MSGSLPRTPDGVVAAAAAAVAAPRAPGPPAAARPPRPQRPRPPRPSPARRPGTSWPRAAPRPATRGGRPPGIGAARTRAAPRSVANAPLPWSSGGSDVQIGQTPPGCRGAGATPRGARPLAARRRRGRPAAASYASRTAASTWRSLPRLPRRTGAPADPFGARPRRRPPRRPQVELVGRALPGSIRRAQPFVAERVGLAAERGLDLAAQGAAPADAHSPASGGSRLAPARLRSPDPVRAREAPRPRRARAARSSSAGRSSNALKRFGRLARPLARPGLDRVGGGVEQLGQARLLARVELAQDVVDRVATRLADPDPQPAELLVAELVDDRPQAVVAAGAPALAEPQLAERQGEVVDDHQHLGQRRALAGEDLADRQPRLVHERQRLDERPGRGRCTGPARPTPRRACRPRPDQPARSARRSRTIQPMLWRVFSYWEPGLPRPTTIFTAAPTCTRTRPDPGSEGLRAWYQRGGKLGGGAASGGGPCLGATWLRRNSTGDDGRYRGRGRLGRVSAQLHHWRH